MSATQAAARLSVVTPAYNEADNLPALHARLVATTMVGEWIVVDDHSSDATYAVLATLVRADERVRGIRLARRCGAHAAIMCGLMEARGDAVAVLAADLQDPPELLAPLAAQWGAGTPIVWAVRRRRVSDTWSAVVWSSVYHWLVRTIGGVRGVPAGGAGFFLIDRCVVEALRSTDRRVTDVFALIGSLGYPYAVVTYDRSPRHRGTSRWTVRRKVGFAVQSLLSLSPLAVLRASTRWSIEARIGHVVDSADAPSLADRGPECR